MNKDLVVHVASERSKLVDIGDAKALLVSAGIAMNVAQADIQRAAVEIAQQYGISSSREIEAEIARHLRNQG